MISKSHLALLAAAAFTQAASAVPISIHGNVFSNNFVKTGGSYAALMPPPYELDFDLAFDNEVWASNETSGLTINHVSFGANFAYNYEPVFDSLSIWSLDPYFTTRIYGISGGSPAVSVEGYYGFGLFLSISTRSQFEVTAATASVPEPSTLALIAASLVAAVARRGKLSKRSSGA